jgi:hypothetical protein
VVVSGSPLTTISTPLLALDPSADVSEQRG